MRHLPRALLALFCLSAAPAAAQLHYTVDLRDPASHSAVVTLRVDSLAPGDSVFQFAATAPGTYQRMDIGRFVRDLRVISRDGIALPTMRIDVNAWVITAPREVRVVQYRVLDTWNTPVDSFPIYPMAGTAIEADHALLNAHALLGFPRGMQGAPVRIRLEAPPGWQVVTPLVKGSDGEYAADSYDHAVDSPFLLGSRLSNASLEVGGVPVGIAVHSPSGGITAEQLREAMRGTLEAAGRFLGKLPVERYVFLFRFVTDPGNHALGAWEHGTSSEYVLPDGPYSERVGAGVTDIAAHEFFHVVTPLNIHSEIIEHFNFERPVPSRHLWMYEGVTEWASEKMQLDAGLMTLEQYLGNVVGKARADRTRYDSTCSLTCLAATSYTAAGARQYGNIYSRGAVVAGLLDIRLLQLSEGRYGLRDLMVDLARDYGPARPFPEDSLLAIVAARTSPEVLRFFDRYVIGAERPPLREYYGALGIDLVEDDRGLPQRLVPNPNATPEQLRLRQAWLRPTPASARPGPVGPHPARWGSPPSPTNRVGEGTRVRCAAPRFVILNEAPRDTR
jgi:predicted metalloprotease with PDZ domain